MIIARRTLLIGLGLVGLRPGFAAAAIQAVEAGTVLSVTGNSIAVFRGDRRQLSEGAPVYLQELLRTGAAARLAVRLGTSTRLSLGEQTRIRIDQPLVERGGELVLERGAMLFDRPDDADPGPLEVTTPFGLIAARGTKFFAGPSNGVFGVFVEHGLVTVRTAVGAITLSDGLGTDVRSKFARPSNPHGWGAARIARAMASVS
jgi:ferric-dicitrate binding protein FerR (iron transport regulator)